MPESKNRKQRRTFTEEFKNQIVMLYQNGKRKCDIINEYDIAPSLIGKWIKQAKSTGSFKEKDNLTPEQLELIELRKRINSLKWRMIFQSKQRWS